MIFLISYLLLFEVVNSQPLCGDFKTCSACTGQRGCLFFDCGSDITDCEWCLESLPVPSCSALCVKLNGRPKITNCNAIGQTTVKPTTVKATTKATTTQATTTKTPMTTTTATAALMPTTVLPASTTVKPTGGGNCQQYTNCEKCNIEGSRSKPTHLCRVRSDWFDRLVAFNESFSGVFQLCLQMLAKDFVQTFVLPVM